MSVNDVEVKAGGQPANQRQEVENRTERGAFERQLPYTAVAVRDRAHIFDGSERMFAAWKWRMEHHLSMMDLIHTLVRTPYEEEYATPVAGNSEAQEEVRKAKLRKRINDDMNALDEIVMWVNNDVLNKLIGVSYAKEAMDLLVKTYQKVGTGVMIAMRDRLFSIKNRKHTSISALFDEYESIIRELDRMGTRMDQSEKMAALMIAIPKRYQHVKGALTVLPCDELCKKPLVEIKRMLLDAEQSETMEVDDEPVVPDVALKTTRRVIECFGCGKPGHYKNKCPALKKKKKRFVHHQGHAMLAGEKKKESRKVSFAVDSGASSHMVNDEKLLQRAVKLATPVTISTAKSGETLQAVKKGKVTLKSVVGLNKIKRIELYDVLFIPNLEENLLSVRKINSMGKRVTFQDKEVRIEDKGEVIAEGKDKNGLYCVDMFLEHTVDLAALFSQRKVSLTDWHKRLGHLSFSGLEKLLKNNMVDGIDISSNDLVKQYEVCESCLAGKQSCKKFLSMQLPRSSRPLELVHTDVCGYMEQSTYDGYRYFVTFTDDFTHFTVVYLIKRKIDVFDRFKEYEAMATAHFGQKLSKMRCDNGREYLGKDFQDYCRNKGIRMIFTVPYTPQQNGVSERINRTLMEKVRALLHQSELSKEMWGEALYVAAYVTNRSPTNALVELKTPFEMWNGRKPDLSNLKMFGSHAYKQIPKEKRHKLDSKTKRLTFVGYANNGYRLWNKNNRVIEISRNVVFDESIVRSNTTTEDVHLPIVVREQKHCENEDKEEEISICNEDESKTNKDDEEEVIRLPEPEEEVEAEEVVIIETSDEVFADAEEDEGIDEQQSELRRGTRKRKVPQRFQPSSAKIASATFDEDAPETVAELKKREDWENWKIAIDEELNSLHENKTWTVVNCLPRNQKAIHSKWVFSVKDDGRYKARLVAKGCSQRPGFDYQDTFAPVARMESVRTILSVANKNGLFIHQMDVKTAFLYGDLEETIFMKLPNDEIGNSQIVRLQKSLYGLKQASRSWNRKFDDEIKKLGFIPLKSDCCVYTSRAKDLILILYVDDILILGKQESQLNWIKSELGKLFQMKDLKEVKHFLGMDIHRDYQNQIMEISQAGYAEKILKRFGMSESKPVSTPLDPNVRWVKSNDDELTSHPFKELLGCLQYLALVSRPDISAAVNILSKYQASPSNAHWTGLKRILRYLRGTMNTKILFSNREHSNVLLGFADADFANDIDDRKSISGNSFLVFGNLVSWSTKRQQTVSLSSTEAELISLCQAAKEGLWLTNLLNELGIESSPFIIMEDNIPCINFTEEPRSHQRMKHLDLKFMFIRELVRSRKLKIEYISTVDQPADAFTKGLPAAQHRKLLNILNVRIEGKC